ncbi:hypothetical protein AOXY_G25646 [Acipenser oxyrinchus oxyrinchus]|uniref:Uncharacterized protein n=1 Tax=Acipenser oxyrinchus oxyrinchus TaxID=40147 RepID=A0AAD8FXA9_ACIOX|nr:hypothetical protein AOXY_G25646 [Acipenser oxyrinchus oxyrinchus]
MAQFTDETFGASLGEPSSASESQDPKDRQLILVCAAENLGEETCSRELQGATVYCPSSGGGGIQGEVLLYFFMGF